MIRRAPSPRGALSLCLLSLCLLSLCLPLAAAADSFPRQPGYDVESYAVNLDISSTERQVRGEATLLLRASPAALRVPLLLNFRGGEVQSVRAAGHPVPFSREGDGLFISLAPTDLPPGGAPIPLHVRYLTRPTDGLHFGKNRYGEPWIHTYSWPEKARHWIPAIDHPSDGARFALTVTVDAGLTAVSNGAAGAVTVLPDGRRSFRFAASAKIPIYSAALAVGPYAIAERSCDGLPLQAYLYGRDRHLADEVLSRTCAALRFYAASFGPYPFEKYAVVEAPISGGMENSSCSFIDERQIGHDPTTLDHELAHQWFGDAVALKDWDHIWLSEGVATFAALLFAEHQGGEPSYRRGVQRLRAQLGRSGLPARIPLVRTAEDPADHLNPVVYEKGALLLVALRDRVGAAATSALLRDFYRRHRGGAVDSEDFIALALPLLSRQGEGRAFFDRWLRGLGAE